MSPHHATFGAAAVNLPADEVGCADGFLALDRGSPPRLRMTSLQVSGPHEPQDPAQAAADALGGEAGPDAAHAGVAAARGVDPTDPAVRSMSVNARWLTGLVRHA